LRRLSRSGSWCGGLRRGLLCLKCDGHEGRRKYRAK
jgi:hypothetical protein